MRCSVQTIITANVTQVAAKYEGLCTAFILVRTNSMSLQTTCTHFTVRTSTCVLHVLYPVADSGGADVVTFLFFGQNLTRVQQLLAEVDLGPGDIVLDGDPAHTRKGAPHISAHVYCVKRSPISATVELLLYNCFTHCS